ncbi:DUF6233 domain-containing protein [Streptomyces sp. NPDC091385]|uniref:DUF6233 domain-containing protein n=1 Tax=Streptomyces sp. NPDC091385 TaxID=3365997 RepID=UPI0037F513AC
MHDLPPDLPRLRTLETWLALALDRVREAIAVKEREEEARRQREARRPPAPDWILDFGLTGSGAPVAVHAGDCRMAGRVTKPVDREAARRALVEGVTACGHCRPEVALGFLD